MFLAVSPNTFRFSKRRITMTRLFSWALALSMIAGTVAFAAEAFEGTLTDLYIPKKAK